MRPDLVEHSHEDHENVNNWSLVESKDGFRYVLLTVLKLPAWEPAKTVYNITVYSFLAVP